MTSEPAKPTRGTVFILLASLAFGSSGPLAKHLMQSGFSPQEVASARIGLAAIVLLLAVSVTQPSILRIDRKHWRTVVAFGLIGVAAVQLLFFVAVSRLPVGVAMLLEYTSPVLVALWVRFVRRTKLSRLSWAGTALAFVGLAAVAQVWDSGRIDSLGLLAGMAAALCSAGYYLLAERGAGEQHPIGMVTWGMVIGALAVFAVAPPWDLPITTDGDSLGYLVTLAVVSTALAYALSTSSLRHLPSTVASVLALTEPVVATLLAWAMLGETLDAAQIVGMVVLLSGALLVQLAARALVTPAEPLPMK
ncbi:EamA family transporter [Actinokineospora enzanensis]|uniref:EamA family transporter n=1 Tax=Actinokineospora enzanensis TaxID=155975 RepID=UPI00035DC3EA|nr:EamA family transporter [Actinokineospora enzanensis]